jgi:hypothetical protein
MTAAASDNPELTTEFNNEFVKTWRSKHNYRVWSCGSHPLFEADNERDAYMTYGTCQCFKPSNNRVDFSHPGTSMDSAQNPSKSRWNIHKKAGAALSVKTKVSTWFRGTSSTTIASKSNSASNSAANSPKNHRTTTNENVSENDGKSRFYDGYSDPGE